MAQTEQAVLETAIKLLDMAIKEGTSEGEIINAISGFRHKAKGRTIEEIATLVYGGKYDGRTLPEYREEWEEKFFRQSAEISELRAERRRNDKTIQELRRFLDTAIGLRNAAVADKLKAEEKAKEAQKSERAAHAFGARTAKAAGIAAKTAKRSQAKKPEGPCPLPVIWSPIVHSGQPASGTEEKTRARAFPWTPELYKQVFGMLQAGRPRKDIEKLTNGNGPIQRAFTNNGPDERYLGPISVASDGPMGYLELWKIGYTLWKAQSKDGTWKGFLCKQYLGSSSHSISWHEPTWLTEYQRSELRKAYSQISNI